MTAAATLVSYRFDPAGELAGARCRVCGTHVCPPRSRHCDQPMEELALPATGTVEAWSTVHVAPSEHKTPFRIAYIRLSDGPRVFAKLAPEFPEDVEAAGRSVRLAPSPHGTTGQTLLTAFPAENWS